MELTVRYAYKFWILKNSIYVNYALGMLDIKKKKLF